MSSFQPVEPADSSVFIPPVPSLRLGSVFKSAAKLLGVPIVLFLVIIGAYFVGLADKSLAAAAAVVSLFAGGGVQVAAVIIMILIVRKRRIKQAELEIVSQKMSVLLKDKYLLDVTPDLTWLLLRGKSLPLMVGSRVQRVMLKNDDNQAVLYQLV